MTITDLPFRPVHFGKLVVDVSPEERNYYFRKGNTAVKKLNKAGDSFKPQLKALKKDGFHVLVKVSKHATGYPFYIGGKVPIEAMKANKQRIANGKPPVGYDVPTFKHTTHDTPPEVFITKLMEWLA